jgi:hypothetical protein
MHHKWNQQSGNQGSDLYIATVDDFIQALMQVVRYYQYLKGDRVGTGPGKEELQLRTAQRTTERTGDPKVLNVAMAKLPGAKLFCTRAPHMAGEEVFGSQKRKADVLLGFEGESHWPDKVNFSRSRIATRSSRANHASCSLPDVVEEVSPELQEDQAPNNLGTMGDRETRSCDCCTRNCLYGDGVAHRQAAQDLGEGLLRPASYHQEEVRGQDCSRQQTHGSPHIHWRYAKHSQEKACGDGVLLLQRRHRTLRQRHKAKVGTVETGHPKYLASEDRDQPLQKVNP